MQTRRGRVHTWAGAVALLIACDSAAIGSDAGTTLAPEAGGPLDSGQRDLDADADPDRRDAGDGAITPPPPPADVGPPPPGDVGPPPRDGDTSDAGTACTADIGCDDGIVCTQERCEGGACVRDTSGCTCSLGASRTVVPAGEVHVASSSRGAPPLGIVPRAPEGFIVAFAREVSGFPPGVVSVDGDGAAIGAAASLPPAVPGEGLQGPITLELAGAGAYAAWYSASGSGSVSGAPVAADGTAPATSARLTLRPSAFPYAPAIAASDAEIAVVWADEGTPSALYVALVELDGRVRSADLSLGGIAGNGRVVWTTDRFVAAFDNRLLGPRVVSFGRDGRRIGDVVAVPGSSIEIAGLRWTGADLHLFWVEPPSPPLGRWRLLGAVLDPSGAPRGDAERLLETDGDVPLANVSVEWNEELGAYGVVWVARAPASGRGGGVFFARLEADPWFLGDPLLVHDVYDHALVLAPSRTGFAVAWRDYEVCCVDPSVQLALLTCE
ncbi:MAG: hypothetical protein IT379_28010 [Deltaproteobacteria bacterium]|nr:hypothetical protein [Deltaproteobacteria bacterium]